MASLTADSSISRSRPADAPELSVVVPTRDRPHALGRCLASLDQQEDVAIEILVVDDGSVDQAALRRTTARHPHARLIAGAGRGPAAARNLGARAAAASAVAFTDDDCEPDPRWAGALSRRLASGATVLAGATVNARPDDPFSAASQAITNHLTDKGRQAFAPSNNVACRTDVVEAFPFEETYPDAAGEDRDWCLRLAEGGHRLEIERAAVVVHRQELGWTGFVRQQLRYGRGARAFRRARDNTATHARPGFYLGLVRAGFAHGPAVGALVLLSQILIALGFLQAALGHRGSTGAPR